MLMLTSFPIDDWYTIVPVMLAVDADKYCGLFGNWRNNKNNKQQEIYLIFLYIERQLFFLHTKHSN